MNPLLFRVQQTVAHLLGTSSIERRKAQYENIRVHFLNDQFGRCKLFPDDVHFIRRTRLAAANHGHFDPRTRLAIQEIHSLANRHVARGKSANRFEQVSAANPGFDAGAIRQDR